MLHCIPLHLLIFLLTVQSLLLLFSDALYCGFVYTCLFCAGDVFLCTTVFAVAVAVFLPGFCVFKFLRFSDIDDGLGTEIDFSILVFNILILNKLTDFVLVQIVYTVYQ